MTRVPRHRPVRTPMVRCGTVYVQAHDDPKYTRTQIGRYARELRTKLYACSDCQSSADRLAGRRFVRHMIACKGEAY